jgi:hypothetical protein
MLSACAFNRLANISLAAGILSLCVSASLELSRWTRGEASEHVAVKDDSDYREDNAPEIMPARFSIERDLRDELAESAPDEVRPVRIASLNQNIEAIAGAARTAASPKEAKLAALPVKPGIIFEELGKKVCIGGTKCEEHCRIEADGCEVRATYAIRLDRPAYISGLQLYAHDQVGPTRRASLLVKVNGDAIGKSEVYRFGSTISIKVGRIGQLVTVESLHAVHGFQNGGEEAVIWDVYVMGREPR